MVFSIFKKQKNEPANTLSAASAEKKTASTPANPQTLAPSTISPGFDDLGIEVSSSDALSAAEEQAAMAYAGGQDKEAQAALKAEVSILKGQRRLDTWLMLFELYQQTGQQTAFEELGLEFVAEFEKTPPIWRKVKAATATNTAQTSGNTCTFGAKLTDATLSRELETYRAALTRGVVRLDFSKVTEIDALAASELLSAWQKARKPGQIPQVAGWQSFAKLLSSLIETGRRSPAEAPFWLLLTEVYQALGQQEEFENLAIDYAITFEVSPPSWDPRFAPKVAIRTPEKTLAAPATSNGEGLEIPGNLTAQNPAALTAIRDYAKQGAGHLLLDFGRVDRLDFDSAGQLINLFMALLQEGKAVHIKQCNELVLAMLRIMSITEMADVERRKV